MKQDKILKLMARDRGSNQIHGWTGLSELVLTRLMQDEQHEIEVRIPATIIEEVKQFELYTEDVLALAGMVGEIKVTADRIVSPETQIMLKHSAESPRRLTTKKRFPGTHYELMRDCDTLKHYLKQLANLPDNEYSRYDVHGILFDFKKDYLRLAATNGRRVGVAQSLPAPHFVGAVLLPMALYPMVNAVLDGEHCDMVSYIAEAKVPEQECYDKKRVWLIGSSLGAVTWVGKEINFPENYWQYAGWDPVWHGNVGLKDLRNLLARYVAAAQTRTYYLRGELSYSKESGDWLSLRGKEGHVFEGKIALEGAAGADAKQDFDIAMLLKTFSRANGIIATIGLEQIDKRFMVGIRTYKFPVIIKQMPMADEEDNEKA